MENILGANNMLNPQDYAKFNALSNREWDIAKTNAMLNLDQQRLNAFNQNSQFGFNMPTLQLGLQGLSALAGIWAANKQLKQARDQFNYMKGVTDANLNNSIKSYNTALADRINTRAKQNGNMTQADVADYITKNQMTR